MKPFELTIAEAAALLNKRKLSSEELTRSYLERIDKLNPRLHAYLTVTAQEALEAARTSDKRKSRLSALDGIPLALKDNLVTRGIRTTAGSRILADFIPVEDATPVRKLKEAGAVILGKTNLDEFAMGSSTENSAFGPTKNPWDTARVPGGSSGGSAAAVAADLAAGALGSDTGGSIRQPAGFSGVVGFKPTYGAVSRYGLIALASSLDCPGPFGKTVADTRLLFETIAGRDDLDATSIKVDAKKFTSLKGVKIGRPKEYFGEGLEADVKREVEEAITTLKKLGAEIVDISLPHSQYALAVYYIIQPAEASSNLARYDGIKYGFSVVEEGARGKSLLDVYLESRGRGFGPEPKRRIMLGTYTLSAGYVEAYYKKALRVRHLIIRDFEEAFEEIDLIVAPTSPTVAFKLGAKADPVSMYLADIYTVAANVAGLPAVSLPCGLAAGLPVGLQLMGRSKKDYDVLAAAAAYEQATAWHHRSPKL